MVNKVYIINCPVCQQGFALALDERWQEEEEKWQKDKHRERFVHHECIVSLERDVEINILPSKNK